MPTNHEQELIKAQIQAYENMIRQHEQQIAKLYRQLDIERCCFDKIKTRLPVIK